MIKTIIERINLLYILLGFVEGYDGVKEVFCPVGWANLLALGGLPTPTR
jgi:hypothetical protein